MKITKKVIHDLEKYGFDVKDAKQMKETNEMFLNFSNMFLNIDEEKKKVAISFHAGLTPDKAANLVLILSDIIGSDVALSILESHCFKKDGSFLLGKDAFDNIEKEYQTEIVSKFIKKQTEIAKLLSVEPFNC
jgi:hypothetical protein